MSQYENLIASKDLTIKSQWFGMGILVIITLSAIAGWILSPSKITIHHPPDLTAGAIQHINEIPKSSIYTFGFYIFQQLNRWPEDGESDYFNRIHTLKNYMTPQCWESRMDDYEERKVRHELKNRERAVWEIPGRGFRSNRVKKLSNSTWIASVDLHVQETYRGENVKDRFINYPLRIVRYDVDAEENPFGLALDCYQKAPRIIEINKEGEE